MGRGRASRQRHPPPTPRRPQMALGSLGPQGPEHLLPHLRFPLSIRLSGVNETTPAGRPAAHAGRELRQSRAHTSVAPSVTLKGGPECTRGGWGRRRRRAFPRHCPWRAQVITRFTEGLSEAQEPPPAAGGQTNPSPKIGSLQNGEGAGCQHLGLPSTFEG